MAACAAMTELRVECVFLRDVHRITGFEHWNRKLISRHAFALRLARVVGFWPALTFGGPVVTAHATDKLAVDAPSSIPAGEIASPPGLPATGLDN
jgi:hypothetical protein